MKNILVPTDFSQQAENALLVAHEFARKSGSAIHLLHVMDVSMGGGFGFNTMGEPNVSSALDQVYVVKLMEVNKSRLTDIASKLQDEGVTVTYDVQAGNIFSTISQQATDLATDLIVMGTKGSSGLEQFLVGSNTEKVVRHAPCPVLSVRNVRPGFSIQKIVFASNFENDQLPAISHLKKFQELFGAHVYIVYVNVPNHFANTREIQKRLAQFAQRYQLTDYNFTVYNDDSEEDGIIHYADEVQADVIAVATHGRTGLSHLLSGSIAEDVVNHANRPVLTFNLKTL